MRASRAEYHRQRRKVLRSNGICTVCQKRKAAERRATCVPCLDRIKARRRRLRKDDRRCWSCLRIKEGMDEGCKLCAHCNDAYNLNKRARRQRTERVSE